MRNFANLLLFQAVWFSAVLGAAAGRMWVGPLATGAFLLAHLRMIDGTRERRRELGYVLAVGALGAVADSLLRAAGATVYPTSDEAWSFATAPPWIWSLWAAFAMLPRYSLAWLLERPRLAALFGAVGGPLSFLAGTRFGAVAAGELALVTWIALAMQYAVATPLLLRFAPRARAARRAPPATSGSVTAMLAQGRPDA